MAAASVYAVAPEPEPDLPSIDAGEDVTPSGFRDGVARVASAKLSAHRVASSKSIRIADFDFDLDKDGKVDPFEASVLAALRAADTDGSGTLTPAEMVGVLKGMVVTQKANRRLSRMVGALAALVVLLIGTLVGISITGAVVGGEAIKESNVPDCQDSSDPRCDPTALVRVGTVESFAPGLFNLANAPPEQLAYLRDVTMYIDMSSGVVGATFKIAGAYKASFTQASLVTTNGFTIYLDADAQSGSITMDGSTYPVLETAPADGSGRARELEAQPPMLETVTARELAMHHGEAARRRALQEGVAATHEQPEARRRTNVFGGALMTSEHVEQPEARRKTGIYSGALMTSGSFTMMASASGFRRRLEQEEQPENHRMNSVFSGALMTSGSFTMMASGCGFRRRLEEEHRAAGELPHANQS